MDILAENKPTDIYRKITETIISAIEQGASEFVMPWHAENISRPQNALTQNDYHGVNILALWAEATIARFATGWWATYKQWQEIGAQVRRGEKASTIVFFKRVEDDDKSDRSEPPIRLVARVSLVFNADQVGGWSPPETTYPHGSAEVVTSVARLVAASKAVIEHDRPMACYRIGGDYIEMPPLAAFRGSPTSSATEAYAATILHELVHWTGAKHRLDRGFGEAWNRERLAAEELVAEIGAAYLCADLGVSNTPRPDHAAYVACWLKLLWNDKRAIFAASRLADRAATYLNDLAAAP